MYWLRHLLSLSILPFLISCIPGSVLLTEDNCFSLVEDAEYTLVFNSEADREVFPGHLNAFDVSLERVNQDVAVNQEPFALTAMPSSSYIDVNLRSQTIRVDGEPVRVHLMTDSSARPRQYYVTFQAMQGERIVPACLVVTVKAD